MIRRAVLLLLASLVLCAGAGQAQAAGYRYWSFWDRDGDRWVYATQGPSTTRPSDGDVQGFRFAVSEDSGDAARPRGEADFKTICATTPARDAKKRVALLLDFGTTTDAPSGETPPAPRTACAQVSPDATTAEALATVAKPLRYDAGALLCAISGYPEKGCGEQISKQQQKPTEEKKNTSGGGPSLGLVAGIAVVGVLGAAAIWQVRRRA
ncbi:SCO2322 family protein [Streptomyces africanus]|uniref:SCO2322 family protein n=1 Tax=Streptomyces africanus TaxID=231024 RepID=UPI000A39D2A6|nr:SCO2322 family protein [Streptomyces africanus]